jgi:coproporphyrinogen III oxidase-like Fe-S oxidoreductase
LTGLYVHIPFCSIKCFYCDFAAFAGKQKQMDRYLAALEKELGSLTIPIAPEGGEGRGEGETGLIGSRG